jgi:hypothetical protein
MCSIAKSNFPTGAPYTMIEWLLQLNSGGENYVSRIEVPVLWRSTPRTDEYAVVA